jgi:AraC-like DNA-binding protein
VPDPEHRRFQESTAVQVVAGADRIALAGRLDDIRTHQHAAPVIVVGLDRPVRFLAASGEHTGRAVLVAPGFAHAVEAQRGRLALFLLPAGAAPVGGAPIRELARPRAWHELGAALAGGALDELAAVDRCLARERLGARPLDDRLGRAVARLADRLEDNTSIDAIADEVGLSASRLIALAHAQLGAPLRSYRRWLRTIRVAREFAAGASITEAAHASGFASSAHLAMAAREHFGIRPSDVLSPHRRDAIRAM